MTPQEASPVDEDRKRSLDRRLAGGVAWTAGAKWVTQFFSWASLVITAHLLPKEDYGVGGMAGFFFILTNVMAEFGVGTATLHMAEMDEEALHQLHGFSLMICGAAYGLSLLAGPFIARFFHNPALTPVLAVTNLSFLITGFQAVPTGLLQRDMDYRKLSISEAMLYIVQAAVTVIAAWLGWGYWALVAGALAGKTTNAVMVMCWKPLPFAFPRREKIRAPLEFGRRAAIGQLAWSAYLHSDGIIVGRMLGEAALGSYQMALNLASAPAEKISMLIMRTAGPLFANVQNDIALVRRYFLLLAETLNLAVVPAMAGLIMVAPEAIHVILGPGWASSVQPLRWLAVYMVISTMTSLINQVLVSQRYTKLTMRMSLINLCVMPASFILGAHWYGPTGVAAAWAIAAPLTTLPPAIILVRKIGLRWTDYVESLWPTIVSAGAMLGTLILTRKAIAPQHWAPASNLIVLIAAGAITYAAVLGIFFRGKILKYVRFAKGLRRPSPEATSTEAAV